MGEVPEEVRVEGTHLIEALERVVEDGCHTEEGAGEGVCQHLACLGSEGESTEIGLTASGSLGGGSFGCACFLGGAGDGRCYAERAQTAVPVIGERTASPALAEGDATESDLLWVVEVEAFGGALCGCRGLFEGIEEGSLYEVSLCLACRFAMGDEAVDVALQLVGGERRKAKEAVGALGGASVRGEEAKSG